MTAHIAESDAARLAAAQLDALAADLSECGFLTEKLHEEGTLKLRVVNGDVPSCREHIAIEADDNGMWWFLWSWGDRITLVGDVAAATFKIAYVLTPQAGG